MSYPYFDTMIAEYLLDSGSRRYALSDLALKYLDYTMIEYEEVTGKGKDQVTFDQVDVEKATQYSAEDAEIALSLQQILMEKLKEEDLYELFTTIEMPLVPVLARMEEHGIKIDVPFLAELSRQFQAEMNRLQTEITELAGGPFNLNSPKQLQVVLFETLKLPIKKKTKTGPSTDITVLEELAKEHPLPAKMVEYREYQKLKSTYVDALPQMVNPDTGRVHTSYNQTIAATGRLSSTNPNLQNIPIRTELGKQLRKAFIASEGHVLLSIDYSQIELRIFAHIADETGLIEAFQRGEDIHTSTASRIFNLSLAEVSKEQRRYAKTINFGLMYGMGPFRLSNELGITMDEAKQFIEQYFAFFPNIKATMDQIIEETKSKGYTTTLFGRKRYIPEINNLNRNLQEAGKREAVNSVIQGTNADVIKIAMIRLDELFRAQNVRTRMLLQIHDELLFEVPENELDMMKELIPPVMESVIDLKAPLKVELGTGKNWLEAHE